MNKTVRVDELMIVAKQEVRQFNKALDDGRIEKARRLSSRISAYITAMSLAIPYDTSPENWCEQWEKIYNAVWDISA